MKKTLYSLMLNEEVVREVDALAHRLGTSRSNLIDVYKRKALLRQNFVQNDLIIRPANVTEKLNTPCIVQKQLFRHGFCTSLGVR